MGLFDLFRSKTTKQSADIAKERLQIIVAHQRAERSDSDDGVLASPEILAKEIVAATPLSIRPVETVAPIFW